MSLRHIRAITRKEILHILRDRSTFVLVLIAPVTVLFIMAYALTVDIENVPIGVLDHDRSAISRAFIRRISAGRDLDLLVHAQTLAEVDRLLVRGTVKAVVIIQPRFGQDFLAQRQLRIQILIDGTEPESGTFAMERISSQAEAFATEALEGAGPWAVLRAPIEVNTRALYNPSLKRRVDLVPGLISIVLAFPAMSVALALAHEREHGTLEQIMVTPITRAELLLGKMIPYVGIGLTNVIVIPIVSIIAFGIPVRGSFALFALLSVVFLFAMLSMGTLIGVFMRTQPAALALSFLMIFFPGFFLTGVFFPIAAMPDELQMEAMLLPGTHYAIITRGIFLRAVGVEVLWPNVLALAGLGLVFVAIAAFAFKKTLG